MIDVSEALGIVNPIPPDGVFFLAFDPSGEPWERQTGGYACHWRRATGRLEPLPFELQDALKEHFVDPNGKYGGWCATSPHAYGGIDQETADWLNKRLAQHGVTVDQTMLKESEEAWILCLRDGKTGVLTWENSD